MSQDVALPEPPSPWLVAPDARRFVPVVGLAAWVGCAHNGTRTDPTTAEVLLTAEPAAEVQPPGAADRPEPAGLAFDRFGCLYHGVPERGQVQRIPWPERGDPVDLLGDSLPPQVAGGAPGGVGFVPVSGNVTRPLRATALAADSDEHLFVLDAAASRVAVVDLADGHLLRTVTFPAVPVDLAPTHGRTVLVLTASRAAPLLRLDALRLPVPQALPEGWDAGVPAAARPSRVAASREGAVWVLLEDGDDGYLVRALPGAGSPKAGTVAPPALRVLGSHDLEVDGDGRPVVAGSPGQDFLTWTPRPDGLVPAVRLRARGYDGRGIVRTPDGRIGYATGQAFRVGVPERVRYAGSGTVDTPRLDGLSYGMQWGRVFVEACVPPDTTLKFATRTSDDPTPTVTSMPVDALGDQAFGEPDADGLWLRPLHRRATGRELAWAPLAKGDRYEVYEAPVVAPPGRYLSVRLALSGTGAGTPRIRALRAEIPGRDLVAKLPRTYRRDPVGADLLRRFLAIMDGQLGEIESRAVRRDLLLDPWGAPPELLPWLGSLVGLTLDTRWPEPARRTVLAESMALFRTRGTVAGLRRLLEIYLGFPVVIVEAFRLRARPAAIGGPTGVPGPFDAVLGGGWRVAGGPGATAEVTGPVSTAPRAHRFTVLLTCDPDDEQLAVVRDVLDHFRPAHTLVEICSIGAGMRVGINLHAGLSTYVSAGSGFRALRVGTPATGHPCSTGCDGGCASGCDSGCGTGGVVGDGTLGVDGIVGRGRAGIRPGVAELGRGTVIDG